MPFWNDQGMPGINWIGIKDSNERPVLKNKGVGFAASDFAKITILFWWGAAHNAT
jgi:hypothetical protein